MAPAKPKNKRSRREDSEDDEQPDGERGAKRRRFAHASVEDSSSQDDEEDDAGAGDEDYTGSDAAIPSSDSDEDRDLDGSPDLVQDEGGDGGSDDEEEESSEDSQEDPFEHAELTSEGSLFTFNAADQSRVYFFFSKTFPEVPPANILSGINLLVQNRTPFHLKWGVACWRCIFLELECCGPSDPHFYPYMKCSNCQKKGSLCSYTPSKSQSAISIAKLPS